MLVFAFFPILCMAASMQSQSAERPSAENVFKGLFPNDPFPECNEQKFNNEVDGMKVWDAKRAAMILLPCVRRLSPESKHLYKLLDFSFEHDDLTLIKYVFDFGRIVTSAEAARLYIKRCKLRHLGHLPEDLRVAVNAELPDTVSYLDIDAKLIVGSFLIGSPVGHRHLSTALRYSPTKCSRANLLCHLQVFSFFQVATKFIKSPDLDAKTFIQVCQDRQIDWISAVSPPQRAILTAYADPEVSPADLSLAYNHLVVNNEVFYSPTDDVSSRVRFALHLCTSFPKWAAANIPIQFWANLSNDCECKPRLMAKSDGKPDVAGDTIDIHRFAIKVRRWVFHYIPLPAEIPNLNGISIRSPHASLCFTLILAKQYSLDRVLALFPQIVPPEYVDRYRNFVIDHVMGISATKHL